MNKKHNETTLILLQSIILIIICCACLIGSTFAWFTSETNATVESIVSSKLGFDITVTEKMSGTQINIDSDSLQSGNAYIVNLSISDTSTAEKGYCMIAIDAADGRTSYYTPMFEKGVLESKSFELVIGKECKMSVISFWGTHNNEVCEDKINYFAYNIAYNLDGGTVGVANPTIYSVNDTITLNNPTRYGFDFVGWIGSNGDTPQTTITIEPNSTGDKTYTAIWQEIETYNIAYDLKGGEFVETAPTTYNKYSESFNLPVPIKEGCVFIGWTGSNGDNPETVVTISSTDTGNKNYVANWKVEEISPTSNSDDEEDNSESSEPTDEDFGEKEEPLAQDGEYGDNEPDFIDEQDNTETLLEQSTNE